MREGEKGKFFWIPHTLAQSLWVLALAHQPAAIDDYIRQGIDLAEKGLPYEAILEFSKAIELNPELATAYMLSGIIYDLHKHEYDKAIAHYDKAIELEPELDIAYCGRGHTYIEKKEYSRALADLNRAIELNPELASAYIYRGLVYFATDESNRGIADLNEAIGLDPDLALAYLCRGVVYLDSGEYSRALADLNMAIELGINDASTYSCRGHAFCRTGEHDRGISDLNRAIELNPELATAYNYRGWAYFDKHEYDEAIADYDKAIELDPVFALAYAMRGVVYSTKREVAIAVSDLEKAIDLTDDPVINKMAQDILDLLGSCGTSLDWPTQQTQLPSAYQQPEEGQQQLPQYYQPSSERPVITVVGTYLPTMVTFAPVETTGLGRSVVGLIIQLVNPFISNETLGWFYLPIWLVLMLPVEGWVLRQKSRSLWHLLWGITPFGWIVILCLKNKGSPIL